MWLPLCSNAHDDVTDLEICEYHKNTNAKYFENETFFSSNKKIQGYYMAKIVVAFKMFFFWEFIK